ncbi:MAG: imidazole glycerol phosphate synthase subunit HisH [Planctomycetota bacterium]
MTPIAILNYGLGNLRSVQKAFEHVGAEAVLVEDPGEVMSFGKVLLPGVGNFADGMQRLEATGFGDALRRYAETGRPLMGICMGLQFFFDSSEEVPAGGGGVVPGLGLIPGRVVRFREERGVGEPRLTVPHMGWNTLAFPGDGGVDPVFVGLPDSPSVYFVHSYYAVPDDPSHTAAMATHGEPFAAAVRKDHLFATQFHPEKSQRVGLKMLKNFVELDG